VVVGDGLLQLSKLGAHPGPGELHQHLRIALSGDQGGHHVPPEDPEKVRGATESLI
jgi:hypothetical protein